MPLTPAPHARARSALRYADKPWVRGAYELSSSNCTPLLMHIDADCSGDDDDWSRIVTNHFILRK